MGKQIVMNRLVVVAVHSLLGFRACLALMWIRDPQNKSNLKESAFFGRRHHYLRNYLDVVCKQVSSLMCFLSVDFETMTKHKNLCVFWYEYFVVENRSSTSSYFQTSGM